MGLRNDVILGKSLAHPRHGINYLGGRVGFSMKGRGPGAVARGAWTREDKTALRAAEVKGCRHQVSRLDLYTQKRRISVRKCSPEAC